MEKRTHNLMLLNAEAEGLSARIVLDELLEQKLDSSVLAIDSFSREADPTRMASAVASLRVLKKYRQRHPRKTEAVIDETIDDWKRGETHDEVKRILDETNDANPVAGVGAGRLPKFIEMMQVAPTHTSGSWSLGHSFMRDIFFFGLWLAVGLSGGCVTQDLRGSSDICEVHHVRMRSVAVPLVVGWVDYFGNDYQKAMHLFPHIPPAAPATDWRRERIYVCDECVRVEHEWLQNHK